MIMFSQQDPRWANLQFGGGYTIGRYGCVISCLTMARNWFFNDNKTPDWAARLLLFSSGAVIWSSISNIGLRFVQRVFGRNDAVINEALINPNKCCLIQVNNNHWLWLIGRLVPGRGWKVVDPWHGDICYTDRYGNNITGCAVISK